MSERYRPRLLAQAEEFRSTSGDTAADRKPVELDQQSVGRLSRMNAMQQQAMAAVQEAGRRARQVAIDPPLHRLRGGELGWCVDCGEFISTYRFDPDPALMRCVECAR